jgi:hypothetical protein
MHSKRMFLMVVLGVVGTLLLATFAIAHPILAREDNREQKLLGAWNVEVTTVAQGTTFPALLTFTPGGGMIADEPPLPFETSGHGNWVKHGGDKVAYTFVALIGSTEGPLSARLKVVGTLNFDVGKDQWAGPFKIDVFDPEGNVVLSDRGTFRLKRITVESLD